MPRPTASVVIPAWNAWEHTKACLDSLRPTLGVRDEVIVVDNGSTDQTRAGLRNIGWVRTARNATNLGFAAACNQGAAIAGKDIVVFLNSDTVPVGRWLDELLAPFSDPEVVATGPRSNFVSGPQLVPEARYSTRKELRDFERAWRQEHRGQTSPMERLVGFCLAVRKSAFEAVGGFDEGYTAGGYEDDDLCRKLTDAGGRLLVADGSFVHHVGHASFDANQVDWRQAELAGAKRFSTVYRSGQETISAVLIVKDEENNLARCLDSLAGVVDEIVVADTGSVDSTVVIAETHGAKVIGVPWNDDFAEARNAALAASSGDWVLSIDADEEWVSDPAVPKTAVNTAPKDLDGWLVTITNELGHGVEATTSHPAVRLFRRNMVWSGRIHEQVTRPGSDRIVAHPLPEATIVHHGYTDDALAGRGKLARNLRLAELDLQEAATPLSQARAELNVGRALIALGERSEAIPHLTAAADGPEPATARLALHSATRAAFNIPDLELAAELIADLRRRSTNPLLPDLLTVELAMCAHLHNHALAVLATIHLPAIDEDGFWHQPSEVASFAATAYRTDGNPGAALDTLLDTITSEGVCPEPLSALAHDARIAGVDPARIGRALPADKLEAFAAQTVSMDDTEAALAILEGAWGTHPGSNTVLAAASLVAPKAPVAPVISWAARLHQSGLGSSPLIAIARDDTRALPERVLAAALSTTPDLEDPSAPGLLTELVKHATGPVREEVAQTLTALAPDQLRFLPAESTPADPTRKTTRKVSVIVPCWNRAEWTLQLLKSLQATTPDGTYELVIVDNGSTDATAAVRPNPDAGVKVVRNNTNRGFAVACNQGARAAETDTLVFVNNDVIAKPGWLDPILAALDRRQVGIVGPKLLFPDGTIQHAGVIMLHDPDGQGYLDGNHLLYRQPADHPKANDTREMRAVTGAVMAIRHDLFDRLGGFDETYLNGNEDIDLCLRAGEAGWRVLYEPASVLIHQESVSGPERFKAVDSNRARLTLRWAGSVVDERVTGGVTVVGPFGDGSNLDTAARKLVEAADTADIPVTTRAWPAQTGDWAHRLGPGQSIVVSVCDPQATAAWLDTDTRFGYLPETLKVLAGTEDLAEAGLLGDPETAVKALRSLCKGEKHSVRSSWRAKRAEQ